MKLKGLGIASMIYGLGYGFSRPDFAMVEIEISPDASLTIWTGASELGQGLRTVLCQMAAEAFGIPYETVRIISADTAMTPDSGPVSASRSTYVQGNAVLKACEGLKKELISLAAGLFEADPGDLCFQNNAIRFKDDPSRAMDFTYLASEMHARGRRFREIGWHDITTSDVDPETSQGAAYSSYAWASQLAEVEVDTETGRVRVLRIASATDSGVTINPKAAEGQIEGGAVQGLGFALLEDMKIACGHIRNSTWKTYLVPTAADVPHIDSLIVEVPDSSGPFGAKGIGEPATIPTAPAILAAIASAVGIRIRRTPATAERVLTALGVIPNHDERAMRSTEEIPFPPA